MVLALATGSTALLGGTALAAPGSAGAISGSPAHILINKTVDNCSGNSLTIVNGKIVKTAPNCTSSAKGTNGAGGGGGQPGTSTQGTATNNCSGSSTTVVNGVPTTSSGCKASAKGTGGSSN